MHRVEACSAAQLCERPCHGPRLEPNREALGGFGRWLCDGAKPFARLREEGPTAGGTGEGPGNEQTGERSFEERWQRNRCCLRETAAPPSAAQLLRSGVLVREMPRLDRAAERLKFSCSADLLPREGASLRFPRDRNGGGVGIGAQKISGSREESCTPDAEHCRGRVGLRRAGAGGARRGRKMHAFPPSSFFLAPLGHSALLGVSPSRWTLRT